MDDKDYAQGEAIMKEFQTEAMIFQIRVQDLNLRIASVRLLIANFVVSRIQNLGSPPNHVLTRLLE
jgi:hypothetical protein